MSAWYVATCALSGTYAAYGGCEYTFAAGPYKGILVESNPVDKLGQKSAVEDVEQTAAYREKFPFQTGRESISKKTS